MRNDRTAVRFLVDPEGAEAQATAAAGAGGFGAVKTVIEAAVGLDEPPNDLGGGI